jgi:uncharacterized protein involved in exopolysaccharide biosynthesis
MAGRLGLWWRHRRFLWNVLWMSALLSTAVALILPRHFKSTARLVVPDNQASTSVSGMLSRAAGGMNSGLGLDPSTLLGLRTPGAFYAAVLQSRTVQDRLVERFDLRTHYKKKYYQDARKKLAGNTDVLEEKKSGVITLTVTDWDANFAAMLARSYIEEMNRVAVDLNISGAHLEREFLEERLKDARIDLDQAALELSQFSSKHSVTDIQQQGRTMMDAAAELQGQLIGSEAELKGLEQIYSDDNFRVRTLKARVAELQSQLKKMVGNYTAPGEVTGEQAGGTYPAVRTLPALGYRYQELYRETKTQETVFDFLTQQYEIARVEEARELPVFRVMDKPDVPEKKSSPIRSLVVALSVFCAMLIGCWWVVVREKWEQLSPMDSRRLLLAEVRSDMRAAVGRLRPSDPLDRKET